MNAPNLIRAEPFHPSIVLPPGAAERFAHIVSIRDDLHAVSVAAMNDMLEANSFLKAARLALNTPSTHPQGHTPEDKHRLEFAVERAQSQAELARDRAAAREARWSQAATLCLNVETFARRSHTLIDVEPPTPKLLKNETPSSAVERVRAARQKIGADRHRVASAPIPLSEAKAIVKANVEELARAGQPDVYPVIEQGKPVAFAPGSDNLQVHGDVTIPQMGDIPPRQLQVRSLAFDRRPAILPLIAWLMGPALIKRLEDELALVASDGSAITSTERATRLADLAAQMLAAERDEEEFIRLAEAGGTEVARRPDANPRAVLSVS